MQKHTSDGMKWYFFSLDSRVASMYGAGGRVGGSIVFLMFMPPSSTTLFEDLFHKTIGRLAMPLSSRSKKLKTRELKE